jgi:hypothetical protein
MKIYLGGPMFTAAEVQYNLGLAARLRCFTFEVYCPNENLSVNDKTRSDLTGEAIYRADIAELESSNVFLCQVAEDSGTMWEAGYMDCLARHVDADRYLGSIGLATDIRLRTPPDPRKSGADNQAFYLNQFIAGGLKLSLGIYLSEEDLAERLLTLAKSRAHD